MGEGTAKLLDRVQFSGSTWWKQETNFCLLSSENLTQTLACIYTISASLNLSRFLKEKVWREIQNTCCACSLRVTTMS